MCPGPRPTPATRLDAVSRTSRPSPTPIPATLSFSQGSRPLSAEPAELLLFGPDSSPFATNSSVAISAGFTPRCMALSLKAKCSTTSSPGRTALTTQSPAGTAAPGLAHPMARLSCTYSSRARSSQNWVRAAKAGRTQLRSWLLLRIVAEPMPPRHFRQLQTKLIEHAAYDVVNHVFDALRLVIESRNRGKDDRAHACERQHVLQVNL